MSPSHMNSYEVTVKDENGTTLDSMAIDAVNLRIALERLCRLMATRDSGHGQKAVSVTVSRVRGVNIERKEAR